MSTFDNNVMIVVTKSELSAVNYYNSRDNSNLGNWKNLTIRFFFFIPLESSSPINYKLDNLKNTYVEENFDLPSTSSYRDSAVLSSPTAPRYH